MDVEFKRFPAALWRHKMPADVKTVVAIWWAFTAGAGTIYVLP